MIGITVQEAGRLGGLATKNKYGKKHFSEMGKKGGKKSKRSKHK